jgi:hypothetical protein
MILTRPVARFRPLIPRSRSEVSSTVNATGAFFVTFADSALPDGSTIGAANLIIAAAATLTGSGELTGNFVSTFADSGLTDGSTIGTANLSWSWAAGQGETSPITGVFFWGLFSHITPPSFSHYAPRGGIMSFMQEALEDLEFDVGAPTITYRGATYPCVLSSIRRGTQLEVGGFIETIQLTAFIRQNAISEVLTADSTITVVDSEMFSADMDASGTGSQITTAPAAGRRAASRGKQYRVLAVTEAAGGSHWELSLGSVQQ